MKQFDENYQLLSEMYQDDYFPDFLVDKIRDLLQQVIELLETGETDLAVIQNRFDEIVEEINDLQDEFAANDSEIETVARDSIGESVDYILHWFNIDIDVEDAIGARDW